MKINKILTFNFIKSEGDNQEPTIKSNGQHWVDKEKQKKKHNTTILVGYHYTQANTTNVNTPWALLQPTGGRSIF